MDADITFVLQGLWHEKIDSNIANIRINFPKSKIIFSTFSGGTHSLSAVQADEVIFSEDPGSLPSYKFEKEVLNNINRQIVTSKAGLSIVKTLFSVKIRSDATLCSKGLLDLYAKWYLQKNLKSHILTTCFYTLHPQGIEGFLFHISDWFQFAKTAQLQSYWEVPLMSDSDATWFETHAHKKQSNYFARGYRAKFAIEQYIAIHYAQKKGYKTPQFINDDSCEIIREYERFLAEQVIIISPVDVGLTLPKYAHLGQSNYQYFNCLNQFDWFEMYEKRYNQNVFIESSSITFAAYKHAQFIRSRNLKKVVIFYRKIDFFLFLLKKLRLMPVIGKLLKFLR